MRLAANLAIDLEKSHVFFGVDPDYVDGLEIFLGEDVTFVGGHEVSLRFVVDFDIAIEGQIAVYLVANLAG